MKKNFARLLGATFACFLTLGPAKANGEIARPMDQRWAREHLTKSEHMVVMRDGVGLLTQIFRRRGQPAGGPVILIRTPFGSHPYGANVFPDWLSPGAEYLAAGYTIVKQDVRGTYLSEGLWQRMTPHKNGRHRDDVIDESTDGYDTIDWLVEHLGEPTRVCLWGGSFDGFYAIASMIDPHPNLVCAVIHSPTTDWWWDDAMHNGAVQLPHVFWGFASFGEERTAPGAQSTEIQLHPKHRDGYEFFLREMGGLADAERIFLQGRSPAWSEMVAHPTRDAFWEARNIHRSLGSAAPAVLIAGGWFDAEDLYGSLETWRSLRQLRNTNTWFVMGPWEHVQWTDGDLLRVGDKAYPNAHPHDFQAGIQRPFLDHYLASGSEVALDLPRVSVYDTGAMTWSEANDWPPAGLETCQLFLREGGVISSHPPARKTSFSQFASDPAKPVPYSENHYLGLDSAYMNADQRFASRRPDVLVFASPALEEPVTLVGPIQAALWGATDRQDMDWVVKLIDVYPPDAADWEGLPDDQRASGYQMLVRGEIMRGRYRDSLADPKAFEPGVAAETRFTLNDVQHTFRPGHRIMLHIQSTWFPLFDRNPQQWVENIFLAEDDDYVAATHTLFHESSRRSLVGVSSEVCPSW